MATTELAPTHSGPAYEVGADRADAVMAQLRKVAGRADASVARGIRVGAQDISAPGRGHRQRIFVQSDTPVRIGGHVLVGKLEHQGPGRTVVRPIANVDLRQWRGTEAGCEHCRTRRTRRETFLLQSPAGRVVQVGRDCLQEYAGCDPVSSSEAVLRAELLARLNGILQMESRGGGRWAMTLELPRFVEVAAEMVMAHGYLSAVEARATGEVSTAQRVLAAFREGNAVATRSAARSLARRALTWIREVADPRDDFLGKLREACCAETISARQAGLVCALLLAYRERRVGNSEIATPKPADHGAAFGYSLEALGAVSDLCGMLQHAWTGEEVADGLLLAKVDLAVSALLGVAEAEGLSLGEPARRRLGGGGGIRPDGLAQGTGNRQQDAVCRSQGTGAAADGAETSGG